MRLSVAVIFAAIFGACWCQPGRRAPGATRPGRQVDNRLAGGPVRTAEFTEAQILNMLQGMREGKYFDIQGQPVAEATPGRLTIDNLNALLAELRRKGPMRTAEFTLGDVNRMISGMGRGLFYDINGREVPAGTPNILTMENLNVLLQQLRGQGPVKTAEFTLEDVNRMISGMGRGLFYDLNGRQVPAGTPNILTMENLNVLLQQLRSQGPMRTAEFTLEDVNRMISGMGRGLFYDLNGRRVPAGTPNILTMENLNSLLEQLRSQGPMRTAEFTLADVNRMIAGMGRGLFYDLTGKEVPAGTPNVLTMDNLNALLSQLSSQGRTTTTAMFTAQQLQSMIDGIGRGLNYDTKGNKVAAGHPDIFPLFRIQQMLNDLQGQGGTTTTTAEFTAEQLQAMIDGIGRGLNYDPKGNQVAAGHPDILPLFRIQELLNQLQQQGAREVVFTLADVERMLAGMRERNEEYNFQGKIAQRGDRKLTLEQLVRFQNELSQTGVVETAEFTLDDVERMLRDWNRNIRYNYQGQVAGPNEPFLTLALLRQLEEQLRPLEIPAVGPAGPVADVNVLSPQPGGRASGPIAGAGPAGLPTGTGSAGAGAAATVDVSTRTDAGAPGGGAAPAIGRTGDARAPGASGAARTLETGPSAAVVGTGPGAVDSGTVDFGVTGTGAGPDAGVVTGDVGVGIGPGADVGVGVGPGADVGVGFGPGTDVGVGPGPGADVGVGVGPGTDVGVGPGPGADVGVEVGPGTDVGVRVGPGADVGVGVGPGTDVGVGPGPGADVGVGVGPGTDVGVGSGPGADFGVGPGPGADVGVGPGPGADVGVGVGPGTDVGKGVGPGTDVGVGPGPGADFGLGPGTDIGVGPGPGADFGEGPGTDVGVGPGPGADFGVGPGLDVGVGVGPGTDIGVDAGPEFGVGPGFDVGTGAGAGPDVGVGIGPDTAELGPDAAVAIDVQPDFTGTPIAIDASVPGDAGGTASLDFGPSAGTGTPADGTAGTGESAGMGMRGSVDTGRSAGEGPLVGSTFTVDQPTVSIDTPGAAANLIDSRPGGRPGVERVASSVVDLNPVAVGTGPGSASIDVSASMGTVVDFGSGPVRGGEARLGSMAGRGAGSVGEGAGPVRGGAGTTGGRGAGAGSMGVGAGAGPVRGGAGAVGGTGAGAGAGAGAGTGARSATGRGTASVSIGGGAASMRVEAGQGMGGDQWMGRPGAGLNLNTIDSSNFFVDNTKTLDGILEPVNRGPFTKEGLIGVMGEEWRKARVDPAICRAHQCTGPICYLPYEKDCKYYVVCQRTNVDFVAWKMRCAFGSYWREGSAWTCERVEDLLKAGYKCPNDPCRAGTITRYADEDEKNCRTYWRCVNGVSTPVCCPAGTRFDRVKLECVHDFREICRAPCPLKIEGCSKPGERTQPFYDGNCRTYWDCENGHPHPVCCKPGMFYNSAKKDCDADIEKKCKDKCPGEYDTNVCGRVGNASVTSYPLYDGNCRSYMKCNPRGFDEAYCCKQKHKYDLNKKACVPILELLDPCNEAPCPYGYKEECRFSSVPGFPTKFQDRSINIEFDCAPGTRFDESICTCSGHELAEICNMKETWVKFDRPEDQWSVKNHGGSGWVSIFGNMKKNITDTGVTYGTFNGNSGLMVWPYTQTAFPAVNMRVNFQPVPGKGGKQVLVSNCKNAGAKSPSFVVTLDPAKGMIECKARTETGEARASVPYNPQTWNQLSVIFGSNNLLLMNEDLSQAGRSYRAYFPLEGDILPSEKSLRFGPCKDDVPADNGFTGFMSEVTFSKCLTKETRDFLGATISTMPTEQPGRFIEVNA